MSSNDFLEFDDDSQTQEGSSGRNPFAILAIVLVVILILASIFTVSLLNRRNQGDGQEAAAIEATNAVIAATNEVVNQTIAAMQAEASRPPTETPTPTPAIIDEPTETPTPLPSDTPTVVEEGEGEEGEGEGTNGDGEGDGDGTTETEDATVDGTNETITDTTGVDDTTVTVDSTPDAAFDTTGTDSTLPQTGLDTWTAILLAIFFVGLVIASRRLRSH